MTLSVTPDGRTIVFDLLGEICAAPSTGGVLRQLTETRGEYLNPVWTADGGPDRLLTTVHPPSGSLSHHRAIVQTSIGPDGRVFYPEMIPDGTNAYTLLKSVRLEGLDKRNHARLPHSDKSALSPDGKWVALEEGDNVYLAPFPWPGVGGRPLDLRRKTPPALPITALSRQGGNFPRCVNATTLSFGSATRSFVYHADTAKTDVIGLNLKVPREQAPGTIALTGARIIPVHGTIVYEHGDNVVVDGRIRAVGTSGSVPISEGAKRIDVRGKTMIHGLVDLHIHNHRSPSQVVPRRDYEMAAVLAYGVTTTFDNSIWSQNIFPQAEMVEAGELVGPRIFNTGDPLYSRDNARQNELRSLERTRVEAIRLTSYGATCLKQYQQPERRQRQWVYEVARELGLTVTAEGGHMLYILTMVMDGHTGWEHSIPELPVYGDLVGFIGRAGAFYSPTLVVAGPGPWNDGYFLQEYNLWTDPKLRRFSPSRKLEIHARRREVRPLSDYTFPMLAQGVSDIRGAGGRAAIGAHGQQHGIASHWEMWMLGSAMTPMEALRVATLEGAEMIGVQQDLGSLEAGKLADLVVINGNPLTDIRQTANIAFVMKGGRLYDANTLDELWPSQRPFGRFFWEMDEARPQDVKIVK